MTKAKINLLMVDWDYFFPRLFEVKDELLNEWGVKDQIGLYDWGHSESLFFIQFIWNSRASGFLRNGLDLPDVVGEPNKFWDRFNVREGAPIILSESNSMTASVIDALGIDSVYLYDAHHDCGYEPRAVDDAVLRDRIDCASWGSWALNNGVEVHVRYPEWRDIDSDTTPITPPTSRMHDDGKPVDVVFDAVHICRSGAWVPPWLDKQFNDFAAHCPSNVDFVILDEGENDCTKPRVGWEPDDIDVLPYDEKVTALMERMPPPKP